MSRAAEGRITIRRFPGGQVYRREWLDENGIRHSRLMSRQEFEEALAERRAAS